MDRAEALAPRLHLPDPPTLAGVPVLGAIPRMRRDPIGLMMDAWRHGGPVCHMRFGWRDAYLVSHPEGVRHVLQDNNANYTKRTPGYAALRLVLGDGLVTSEGAHWLRQRRIAQPAFHRQRVASFAQTITAAAAGVMETWAAHPGETVDVSAEMMRLTLRIVGMTLLGAEVGGTADRIGPAITHALYEVNDRITSPLHPPMWVPTPRNRALRRSIDVLDEVVGAIIAARRQDPGDHVDLLAMLMAARDEETGEGMTDRQLRDEVMTIFLAGHETTATALTWTFFLLSRAPDVRRRLHAEARGLLGDRLPTFEDLPRLGLADRVIREAMRLYPPVWLVARSPLEDDEIAGQRIRGGSVVFLSPWVTHRDPAQWPNPEGFDPDRFEGEAARAVPRFAWFPFGGGPRLCIGQSFAMMEAQLILAAIAARFELDLAPGYEPAIIPHITIRPQGGMPMRIAPTP